MTNSSKCTNCTRFREKLVLASQVLKSSNANLESSRKAYSILRQQCTQVQEMSLLRGAKLKRDLEIISKSMVELTGNNNRMLARIQATMYNLQLALKQCEKPDLAQILAKIQLMNVKLEQENDVLRRQMEAHEMEHKRLQSLVEDHNCTIKALREEIGNMKREKKLEQASRLPQNENVVSVPHQLKDPRVQSSGPTAAPEVTAPLQDVANYKRQLAFAENSRVRLEQQLKEKSKQLFVLRASFSELQKIAATTGRTPACGSGGNSSVRGGTVQQGGGETPGNSTGSSDSGIGSSPPPPPSAPPCYALTAGHFAPDEKDMLIETLNDDLKLSDTNLEKAREKIVELEVKNLALSQKCEQGGRLEREVLKAKITALEKALEMRNAKIESSKAEIEKIREILTMSQSQAQLREMESAQLKSQVAAVTKAIADYGEQLALLRQQAQEKDVEIEKLKGENSDTGRKLDFFKMQLTFRDKRIATLEQQTRSAGISQVAETTTQEQQRHLRVTNSDSPAVSRHFGGSVLGRYNPYARNDQ